MITFEESNKPETISLYDNSFELITFEQLANAFVDICKNFNNWQELKFSTGLSVERSKNIFDIYQKLL